MPTTARIPLILTAPTLIALIGIGCSSGDERLVELSRESADRQAEQNRLVETNNRRVLETTNKLVEADAKSRTENIDLHRQIETERSGVNQQRDALEQERRQIADERIRDPIIAESIRAVAGLIAAILPLLVCLFLLRGLFHRPPGMPITGGPESTLPSSSQQSPDSSIETSSACTSCESSCEPCNRDGATCFPFAAKPLRFALSEIASRGAPPH
jgi:hypothetical protein